MQRLGFALLSVAITAAFFAGVVYIAILLWPIFHSHTEWLHRSRHGGMFLPIAISIWGAFIPIMIIVFAQRRAREEP